MPHLRPGRNGECLEDGYCDCIKNGLGECIDSNPTPCESDSQCKSDQICHAQYGWCRCPDDAVIVGETCMQTTPRGGEGSYLQREYFPLVCRQSK